VPNAGFQHVSGCAISRRKPGTGWLPCS
jgi:hypothetical protein